MSKQAELVKYLNKLTQSGELIWTETVEENIFQASFPKYSIQIEEQSSTMQGAGSGATDIVISIFNYEGKKIEELRDTDSSLKDGLNRDPFAIMSEIYILARKQVLGTDEAYDYLLKELEDLDLPF